MYTHTDRGWLTYKTTRTELDPFFEWRGKLNFLFFFLYIEHDMQRSEDENQNTVAFHFTVNKEGYFAKMDSSSAQKTKNKKKRKENAENNDGSYMIF